MISKAVISDVCKAVRSVQTTARPRSSVLSVRDIYSLLYNRAATLNNVRYGVNDSAARVAASMTGLNSQQVSRRVLVEAADSVIGIHPYFKNKLRSLQNFIKKHPSPSAKELQRLFTKYDKSLKSFLGKGNPKLKVSYVNPQEALRADEIARRAWNNAVYSSSKNTNNIFQVPPLPEIAHQARHDLRFDALNEAFQSKNFTKISRVTPEKLEHFENVKNVFKSRPEIRAAEPLNPFKVMEERAQAHIKKQAEYDLMGL